MPDELTQSPARRLLNWLFGYDYFISYAWADGAVYAEALARTLEAKGFEIFFDRDDYASGDDWQQVGGRTLRQTSQLLLVGSPLALQSAPVRHELAAFSQTGRRVIPIDFGGSLDALPESGLIGAYLNPNQLRVRETREALREGPSAQALETILRTFNLVRQDKKRVRALSLVALILAISTVAAGILAVVAWQSEGRARVATRRAEGATRQAEAALEGQRLARIRAEKGELDAKNATALEQIARKQEQEARRRERDQRLLAEKQRRFAEQQTRIAERQTQIARQQRNIAEVRLADSQVGSLRLLSRNREFESAAEVVRSHTGSDPRLRLAGSILEQHRAYPVRFGTGQLPGGIYSLAYDPRSDMLIGAGRGRIGRFDPQSGDLLQLADLGLPEDSSVAALAEPGRFLSLSRGTVEGSKPSALACAPSGEEMNCRPLSVGDAMEGVAWFPESDFGVVLRKGELHRLRLVEDRLEQDALLLADVAEIDQSRGKSTVLAYRKSGTERSLLGIVSAAQDGPVFREWKRPPASPVWALDDETMATRTVADQFSMSSPDWEESRTTRVAGSNIIERDGGVLYVRERFDRGLDAASRMAVLDVGTGGDLLEPFPVDEPIWTYAADRQRRRRYLAGQTGRVAVVDLGAGRVRTMVSPAAMSAPLVVDGNGLVARKKSAIEHVGWRFNPSDGSVAPYKFGASETRPLPGGGEVLSHHCPFACELSPDGTRLVIIGGEMQVVRVPDGVRGAGLLDLANRALADPSLVEWRPNDSGDGPPEVARWLNEDLVLTDNFHGHAVVWNLADKSSRRLDLGREAVASITPRGPVLITTASGRVFEISATGTPLPFGAIGDLLNLFPLDESGQFFVGAMQNPWRAAFLIKSGERFEEILAIPDAEPLNDAFRAGGRLYLQYGSSIRIYDFP